MHEHAHAREWVAALRSGEFEQGRSELRRPSGSYCCLGVACEVYRRATGRGEWHKADHGSFHFGLPGSLDTSYLPDEVRQWLGLQTASGAFIGNSLVANSLASMNDTGHSFEQIANTIESEPEGLFQ